MPISLQLRDEPGIEKTIRLGRLHLGLGLQQFADDRFQPLAGHVRNRFNVSARADREGTLKSLAKYTTITDNATLDRSYDCYMGKVLERAPYMNMSGMQNALDHVARTVRAAKNAKPEQFVDLRFLQRLERSGLLKELYK